MARRKLTEFKAKLLLVDGYEGYAVDSSSLKMDIAKVVPKQRYIVKVDEGVKKRGKQGLIRLDVTKQTMEGAIEELIALGYSRFIVEPMMAHTGDEEQYISIERVREGFRILHSTRGGVEIEENTKNIKEYIDHADVPLPAGFLDHILEVMNAEHMSFVEINPLVVRGRECFLLDAAVLVDSAGEWRASWQDADIAGPQQKLESEKLISDLNNGSPASFSFRVLNPEGSIWLLLSGGGASITIADEAANRGKAQLIGNYGEYSGGPTREETYIYTDTVLKQALSSPANRIAIIVAGGVANFTDVEKTFAGIIDAFSKNLDALKAAHVKVYVRRGGPREKEGLKLMENFLKNNDIYGSIHGSGTVLTGVVNEALEYVDA